MDVFSVTGIAFLLYLISYAAILMIADCDALLFFTTIFGRRKLSEYRKLLYVEECGEVFERCHLIRVLSIML